MRGIDKAVIKLCDEMGSDDESALEYACRLAYLRKCVEDWNIRKYAWFFNLVRTRSGGGRDGSKKS